MPSYISRGYWCEACRHETIELHDRAEELPVAWPCETCAAPATHRITASVMNVALPDGNKRFAAIKETRKLQKVAKRVPRKNKAERARISAEIAKIK